MTPPLRSPTPGFTLAELLIALALLGIIAAFTIPKVLQSSAEQETRAKLRETVAILEEAWHNARATNNVIAGQPLYDTVSPYYNAVTMGAGPVGAAGAPLNSVAGTHLCPEVAPNGWVQFHNGVVVSGLASGAALDLLPANDPSHNFAKNYVICVDVNGAAPPNQTSQDMFLGNFNQYSAFIAAPANEQQSLKSFHWPGAQLGGINNPSTAVFDTSGGALPDNGFVTSALFGQVGNGIAGNYQYAGLGQKL